MKEFIKYFVDKYGRMPDIAPGSVPTISQLHDRLEYVKFNICPQNMNLSHATLLSNPTIESRVMSDLFDYYHSC